MEYLRIILNNALYLSLLVIIISSVVGVFIAGRKRDSCMKDFHKYECRLVLSNGKTVYGKLQACGSGIEIEYIQEHKDTQGHMESSFILYSAEFSQIIAVKRYHRDLSAENKEDRTKEITATYHPSLLRIARRKVRNFFNTFQDGLSKSFSTMIGAVAAKENKLETQKKELSGLGTQVIGAVSHSFDSILERYIGHYVVMETPIDGVLVEFCGILKHYSQSYLEILNVIELRKFGSVIDLESQITQNEWFEFRHTEAGFVITNSSRWPIYVDHVLVDSTRLPIETVLGIGEHKKLSELPVSEALKIITVNLIVPDVADMVVPRATSAIRHGCPKSKHTLETMLGLSSSEIVQKAIEAQFTDLVKAQN